MEKTNTTNLSPVDNEVKLLSEKVEILYQKLHRVLRAEVAQDCMVDEPSNLLNDLRKLNEELEDILGRLEL